MGQLLGSNGADVPKKDTDRGELLVLPAQENDGKSQYGLLIGCLVPENTSNEEAPSALNPRPKFQRFPVGSEKLIGNRNLVSCNLWLCVNDVALDPKDIEKSRRIYIDSVTKEKDNNDNPFVAFMHPPETRWKYIEVHNYWNLWFDDNFGEYQVSCVIE